MGAMSSSPKGGEDIFNVDRAISGAYAAALEHEEQLAGKSGGYSGGCECGDRKGGAAGEKLDLADVSEYVDSINSKSKTRIIESILEAASKLGLKSEGSTPAARIKSLLSAIPSGDRFKKDDKTQAAVCESIAKAINAAYGVKVMETNLPADALCQHIAEILSSLGAGVHTEFLAVYSDVQKVLHNLGLLESQLGEDMKQIKDKTSRCDDGVTSKNLQLNFDLYEMLTGEIKRQVQLLSNLLNVHLIPSASDLSKLLKGKKGLTGYIKKIDLKPGSDKFGSVISDLLKGLGLTANFMLVVEQALSTVGLTLSQYKDMKNLNDLRAAALSKGINLNGDELHNFNDALDLLEKNLSRVKYTQVVGSQDTEMSSGQSGNMSGQSSQPRDNIAGSSGLRSGSAHDYQPYDGGAFGYSPYDGGAEYARSTMDKRVADRKKLRNLIYETFVRQLNGALDKFVGALDILSMKIGTEIPISDQLDGFRQAINRVDLDLSRKRQVYLALIGYYNDAMSKSKRDQVVGEMKMVSSFIDSIVELPMYRASAGYFQAVQAQVKGLLDIIGKYSDEIAAKFGRGEEDASERNGPAAVSGSASMIGDVTGGDEDDEERMGSASMIGDVTGGYAGGIGGVDLEIPAPKFRATKSMSDAVRQFDYKFRVAQIRGNISRAGAELPSYGANYDKITANSLADILRDEQKKYNTLKTTLNAELSAAGVSAATSKELAAAQKFLEGQWDSKKKFWATVEAIDGYMRAFTNGFVNNPNDIKDIRAILDDVEVIRDWYSEASGNQLASVFDHFPSSIAANAATQPAEGYLNPDDGSSHYYQTVEKQLAGDAADLPGNPNNVTTAESGCNAKASLKKMLSSMTALKNLLSVFVHFGSKFGGNDLNKSTFLTPAQIYNNLIEYLQASAFQQGFGIQDLTATSYAWTTDGNTPPVAPAVHATGYTAPDYFRTVQPLGGAGINYGVHDAAGVATPDTMQKRHWGVWMRSVDSAIAAKETPFNFSTEDKYFVLVMKSIAAKILTVTGMYDILDRPHEFNGIRPIRMIMGGSDGETPKVDDGAVALYLRLPLLCQFWRVIFNFDERTPAEGVNRFTKYDKLPINGRDALKISMIPDIDGTFAGLIRLMFRKNRFLDTSAYSDDDIKDIIRECNMIHQKMSAKHPQNTVMETIYELVAEVNRRYGIVARDDRDKYETEFGNRYDYDTGNQPNTDRYSRNPDPADIALLPGEDEEAIPRPSGAERLLEGSDWKASSTTKSKYRVDYQHYTLVKNFRCVIDNFFENPREEYSFNGAIKSTQQKLKKETRDEERFKIVASLVRGVDVYSKVDGIKYLLFHETVVSGLNVLSGIHSMLARFQARAELLNINWIVSGTISYFATRSLPIALNALGAAGAGAATIAAQAIVDALKAAVPATPVIAAAGGANDVPIALGAADVGVGATAGLVAHLQAIYVAGKGMLSSNEVGEILNSLFGVEYLEAGLCASGRGGAANTIRPTNDMRIRDILKFGANATVTATGRIGANDNDLSGVLHDIEISKIKDLFYNDRSQDKDARDRVHCFFRYLMNREFAMKELLESLFGVSSDLQSLVTVRIDDGKIYMNTGGIKGLINELFDQVGHFLEVMRPHIRGDLIAKYTSKIHAGSLYWLQEQLLEKIITGRPDQSGSGNTNPAKGYANFDDQMRGLSDTYQWLTRQFDFSGEGLRSTVASSLGVRASRNSFDKVFASLIFYDGERPGSGLLPSNDAKLWDAVTFASTSPPQIVSWQTDPYEALHLAGPVGAQVLDTRFASRFYQLYSWKEELTLNRSALFIFNQLIAKFVQSFYDPGQRKMYKGLIDQFANGTFNRAINDHRFTFSDVAPAVVSKFTGPEDVKVPKSFPLTSIAINVLANGTGLRGIIETYLRTQPAVISPDFGVGPAAGRQAAVAGNGIAELAAMEAVLANTMIPAVIAAFPFKDRMNEPNISTRELDSRIKMFCDFLWAVWAGSPATASVLVKQVANVSNNLGAASVYSTGRNSEFSYLVKAEDMAGVTTNNIGANPIPGAPYEENMMIYAREAAVGNGPRANSIDKLGIGAPAGATKDFNALQAFGKRADPDGDHVLFTSLAVVIRNLVHTRNMNQTQTLVYMNENAADVPLYMKEKMRANLPAFKNLFRELINRCEFLKQFMMRREMDLNRYWDATGLGGVLTVPSHNPWPWGLQAPVAGESEKAKDRFSSILDTIVRGCQTLITSCDTTLKEIGDDPKYLELYQGSIRDYRTQYSVDPLMPVSSLLAMMQNNTESSELDFFPIHSHGELHFKHMYSGRSLLQNMSSQPTSESVPGWNQTLESFNLMVDNRLQADKGRADGMLKSLTRGLRYLYDLKRVKGVLTPHVGLGCIGATWSAGKVAGAVAPAAITAFNKLFSDGSIVRGDLVGDGTAQITNKSPFSIVNTIDDSKRHLKPVFSLKNPLTRVVMLTESSNKDDQLKALVDYISGDDKKDRSNNLAVQNIIDLNIVPINVHALMREVPLANLYNYAYTYERMIVELFYGLRNDEAKSLIASLCGDESAPHSPKDMLVKLLLDPYYNLYPDPNTFKDIDSRGRAEYVQGMLLGSTGDEGLGRPKFLSDQVFGKAIFGELYNSWAEMSDMGPGVRYARHLSRGNVRNQLAIVLTGVINTACAAPGTKFVQQGGNIPAAANNVAGVLTADPVAQSLAGIIMDDQTASIESLKLKIRQLGAAVNSNAVGVNGNAAYHYALAIIVKTVGTAFFWAINAVISRTATVPAARDAANEMIDALATLTYANDKLNVSVMKTSPVNNKARVAFKHIIDELDRVKIAQDPIANLGGAVRGAVDMTAQITEATNDHTGGPPPPVVHTLNDNRSPGQGDDRSLHYLQDGSMKTAAIGVQGTKDGLAVNGRARFDTVVIRNLVFIVNLYRSVRMKLQQDLTYSKDIVTKSIPITRAQLTEFSGNATVRGRQGYDETGRY